MQEHLRDLREEAARGNDANRQLHHELYVLREEILGARTVADNALSTSHHLARSNQILHNQLSDRQSALSHLGSVQEKSIADGRDSSSVIGTTLLATTVLGTAENFARSACGALHSDSQEISGTPESSVHALRIRRSSHLPYCRPLIASEPDYSDTILSQGPEIVDDELHPQAEKLSAVESHNFDHETVKEPIQVITI